MHFRPFQVLHFRMNRIDPPEDDVEGQGQVGGHLEQHYQFENDSFPTVPELITYHRRNRRAISAQSGAIIRHPIPRKPGPNNGLPPPGAGAVGVAVPGYDLGYEPDVEVNEVDENLPVMENIYENTSRIRQFENGGKIQISSEGGIDNPYFFAHHAHSASEMGHVTAVQGQARENLNGVGGKLRNRQCQSMILEPNGVEGQGQMTFSSFGSPQHRQQHLNLLQQGQAKGQLGGTLPRARSNDILSASPVRTATSRLCPSFVEARSRFETETKRTTNESDKRSFGLPP